MVGSANVFCSVWNFTGPYPDRRYRIEFRGWGAHIPSMRFAGRHCVQKVAFSALDAAGPCPTLPRDCGSGRMIFCHVPHAWFLRLSADSGEPSMTGMRSPGTGVRASVFLKISEAYQLIFPLIKDPKYTLNIYIFITVRRLTFEVLPLYLLSYCFRERIQGTGNSWV